MQRQEILVLKALVYVCILSSSVELCVTFKCICFYKPVGKHQRTVSFSPNYQSSILHTSLCC